MASNKKYWKSVEELDENSTIVEALQQNEFVTDIPTDEFLGDKETLELLQHHWQLVKDP
jgi:molybdopterin-containing oxidoreductase family iron-sulfur binding subunit